MLPRKLSMSLNYPDFSKLEDNSSKDEQKENNCEQWGWRSNSNYKLVSNNSSKA